MGVKRLTKAEDERLSILVEEMGEALQVVGKIKRHGFESWDPTKTAKVTNRRLLEKELGDVKHAVDMLLRAKDVDADNVARRRGARPFKIWPYLHHQTRATAGFGRNFHLTVGSLGVRGFVAEQRRQTARGAR